MVTLPGAWCCRVDARSVWTSARVKWVSKIARWICNFYLRVAACTVTNADQSLKQTGLHLAGTLGHQRQPRNSIFFCLPQLELQGSPLSFSLLSFLLSPSLSALSLSKDFSKTAVPTYACERILSLCLSTKHVSTLKMNGVKTEIKHIRRSVNLSLLPSLLAFCFYCCRHV